MNIGKMLATGALVGGLLTVNAVAALAADPVPQGAGTLLNQQTDELKQQAATLAADIKAVQARNVGTEKQKAKLAELGRVVRQLEANIAAAPGDNTGQVAFLGSELLSLRGQLASVVAALPDCNQPTSDGFVSCNTDFVSRPVVSVPSGASTTEILKAAATVTPIPALYKWQNLELTGFIHFSINAWYLANVAGYQNNGTGDEDPANFNPQNLDAKAWVKTFKDAGFKLIVITAKHHNGFRIWPATTTEFGVASSPWAGIDGNKDVLKAFADAAHEAGIKIGFYLSPSDLYAYRHQRSEVMPDKTVFGNGSPAADCRIPRNAVSTPTLPVFTYQVDEYNCVYMRDLHDLLTKYGSVAELWFDGYDPTGGAQSYAVDKWVDMINKLQSGVALFNTYTAGQTLTWVGNEGGHARETTQWSILPANSASYPNNLKGFPGSGDTETNNDRGSAGFLNTNRSAVKALWWAPSETDTTIAQNTAWFYNPRIGTRSLKDLMQVYFTSVGRNTNLLLNIAPRADGTFHPTEVQRMADFGQQIKNLYTGKVAMTAEADRALADHGPANAVDMSPDTFWSYPEENWTYTADGTRNAANLTLSTASGRPEQFNLLVLQEDIRVGQRVEKLTLQKWDEATQRWVALTGTNTFDPSAARGTLGTIGYKRLVFLGEPVSASKVRVVIDQARGPAAISNVSLYKTDYRDVAGSTGCSESVVPSTFRGTGLCQWDFAGTWTHTPGEAYTNAAATSATIRFKGATGFRYKAAANDANGIVSVRIDGENDPALVDLYSATNGQKVVFTKTGLDPAVEHTVTIAHTGNKNPGAKSAFASIVDLELIK